MSRLWCQWIVIPNWRPGLRRGKETVSQQNVQQSESGETRPRLPEKLPPRAAAWHDVGSKVTHYGSIRINEFVQIEHHTTHLHQRRSCTILRRQHLPPFRRFFDLARRLVGQKTLH